MKKLYLFFAISVLLLNTGKLTAQTIWTGEKIVFTKAANSDWTLSSNQDSITNNVRITRATTKGIFNIAKETAYITDVSPADTKWAFGTTTGMDTLKFDNWEITVAGNPPGMLNRDMVLYLITDSIYIDIKFTLWSVGNAGGGFSYERSTAPLVSIEAFKNNGKVKLFPNPAAGYIQISGLKSNENYIIYNLLGTPVFNGTIFNNEKIDIKNFPSVYTS
ncbi:MAG: T9SS type A sorting domain-containing protein [Draconibacterium sp.]|nr:T9SS type A sorting domain-containing protein [Draconibacterium sp.]